MSLQNVREDLLYDLLPEGVVGEDAQSLMQAVIGGFQDHLDDLRSYVNKYELLYATSGLPEPSNNVILVQLQSDQGKVFTRTLDKKSDTPTDSTELISWAASQLDVDTSDIISAVEGDDLLRKVDIDTLQYLSATVGAVLFQSVAQEKDKVTTARIMDSYFPRLKIKGTAMSFDALGRLIGFDDVMMMPLFQRLSPRMPSDIGAPANDPDFAKIPEFFPRQVLGVQYDPWDERDGPFYTWRAHVTNNGTSTESYQQVINGNNPWIRVNQIGETMGLVPTGAYTLSGGGPHRRAKVSLPDYGLEFEAIGEGDAFNGLVVNSEAVSGSTAFISILDQLSAVKYRSSYFDMSMTVTDENAIFLYGTITAKKNADLAAEPDLCPDGTALSPYRPWVRGVLSQGSHTYDFLTSIGDGPPVALYNNYGTAQVRTQAALSDKQVDTANLIAGGAQAIRYMEETRPATRFPRQAGVGLLRRDDVAYAAFPEEVIQFESDAVRTVYFGTGTMAPLGAHDTQMLINSDKAITLTWPTTAGWGYRVYQFTFGPPFRLWAISPEMIAEYSTMSYTIPIGSAPAAFFTIGITSWTGPTPPAPTYTAKIGPYSLQVDAEFDGTNTSYFNTAGTYFTGSWAYPDDSYLVDFPYGNGGEVEVVAKYEPLTTEVVRPDPTSLDLSQVLTIGYQARPEDEPSDDFLYETADEYPWRRSIVGGGELVETDTYPPTTTDDLEVVPASSEMAIKDQTGAEYSLFGLSAATPPVRVVAAERSLSPYEPGQPAIAYDGYLRNLGTLTDEDLALVQMPTRYDAFGTTTQLVLDVMMLPGYKLYSAGLVNGVLVADPVKFNGVHHRDGLIAWMPFNEHPGDRLTVRDASAVAAEPVLTGVVPSDRQWDPARGWTMLMNGSIAFNAKRDVTDTYTLSFWFKDEYVYPPSNRDTVFQFGPIRLDKLSNSGVFWIYQQNDTGTWGTTGFVPYYWDATTHITVSCQPGTTVGRMSDGITPSFEWVFPHGTLIPRSFVDTDTVLSFRRAGSETDWYSDFRMWNQVKDQAAIDLVMHHQPGTLASVMFPTWFESANNGERYALKVLPSGWLTPGDQMPWVRQPKTARVIRYDSMGRFHGDSRFKETGLGGGQPLPQGGWALGHQFIDLSATGTLVVAGTVGQMPGYNYAWDSSPDTGLYLKLPYDQLADLGYYGTYATAPGGAAYWPNNMDWTNPCRDRIWMEGQDGYIYEVTLSSTLPTSASSTSVPVLVAERISGTRSSAELNLSGSLSIPSMQQLFIGEQRTGALVQLAQPGRRAVVASPRYSSMGTIVDAAWAGTKVILEPWAGTDVMPDLFMYLNSQAIANRTQATAYTVWEDTNSFGATQSPPVAALDRAGQISFVERTAAPRGKYRLVIHSGNIGKTDPQFDGFSVDITVGDTILEGKKLLAGLSGNNVRGTDEFEFELENDLSGAPASWLLTIDWSNPYSNPATGTARRLGIYGYELHRLATSLYKVSLTNATTYPVITQVVIDSGTGTFGLDKPGGWLEYINSYGTVVRFEHEGAVYPFNDTVTSNYPLSDVLTGATARRTEDHYYDGTNVLLADSAWEAAPPYSEISVV